MAMKKIEQLAGKLLHFPIQIALDGPAASGKSTTARQIARELDLLYIDTGAMYRAFTYAVLQEKTDWQDTTAIQKLLNTTQIEFRYRDGNLRIFLNQFDISEPIRYPQVSGFVSEIAAIPEVRYNMVWRQQQMAKTEDSILDGRDIGTVVLPHAHLKIYMVCSLEARTERRWRELSDKGIMISSEAVRQDIEKRDRIDSQRSVGPLQQAADAILLDTSALSIGQQVSKVIELLEKRLQLL